MKTVTFLISLFCLVSNVIGQELAPKMKDALQLHEISKTPKEQLKGLRAMESLTIEFPNEWLPNFWAGYFSTQMVMLKDQEGYPKELNVQKLMEKSLAYIEKAEKISDGSVSDQVKSDIYALRSLALNFMELNEEDPKKRAELKQQKKEQSELAVFTNPESPTMMVFAATELARKEDIGYAEAIASVELMKRANERFAQKPNRAMTTFFNQEWIQFWLPYLEGRLTKIVSSPED